MFAQVPGITLDAWMILDGSITPLSCDKELEMILSRFQTRSGEKPYLRYVRYLVSCQKSLNLATFKTQSFVDGDMFFSL